MGSLSRLRPDRRNHGGGQVRVADGVRMERAAFRWDDLACQKSQGPPSLGSVPPSTRGRDEQRTRGPVANVLIDAISGHRREGNRRPLSALPRDGQHSVTALGPQVPLVAPRASEMHSPFSARRSMSVGAGTVRLGGFDRAVSSDRSRPVETVSAPTLGRFTLMTGFDELVRDAMYRHLDARLATSTGHPLSSAAIDPSAGPS